MRNRPTLTSADTQKVMAACKEKAARNGWNVCIAVVDDSGILLQFERLDDASPMSVVSAIGKAQTSAMLRQPSGMLSDLFTTLPGTIKLPGIPIQGGLPIMHLGQCVGAIGVSGVEADEDEQVAAAGLSALA
jgi:glc operon protein GlcG